MMIRRTLLFIVTVGALGAAWFHWQAPRVQAATPASQKLERVQARCDVIKTRLEKAQDSDLRARVKLGRAYDQQLLAFITAFNSRIAANNVEAPELLDIAIAIEAAADASAFGRLYTIYADDLSNALASDCKNDPAAMYGWIEKARIDRAALAAQVQEIDRLTGEYIQQLQALEKSYTPVINKPDPKASESAQ